MITTIFNSKWPITHLKVSNRSLMHSKCPKTMELSKSPRLWPKTAQIETKSSHFRWQMKMRKPTSTPSIIAHYPFRPAESYHKTRLALCAKRWIRGHVLWRFSRYPARQRRDGQADHQKIKINKISDQNSINYMNLLKILYFAQKYTSWILN